MSTGQILGGGIGAAIGVALAVPTGGTSLLAAQVAGGIYGAQIGIMAGGLLDPPKGPTVEGPRLGDLSVQTSTYGQFIPRTYGTIGLSGNVFWLENNQLKEVVRKKKSGGKGGGSSSTVKTYTYFATFAVGLCEGPIAGVRRIWVGPDLVYDAGSDDLETIISSNQASSGFTIYLGTDTQQPDPRMQAEMGVADCPAFRGLAYIVVKDLPLTDYGNSVAGAQVKVEIVSDGAKSYFNSIISVDSGASYAVTGNNYDGVPYIDSVGSVVTVSTPSVGVRRQFANGSYSFWHDGDVLPLFAGTVLSCGYLANGTLLTLSVAAASNVQFVQSECSVLLQIPPAELPGLRMAGITVSQNGEYIFAFMKDGSILSDIAPGVFYLFNKTGELLLSGLAGDLLNSSYMRFGRSGELYPISSCVSNDGSALYTFDSTNQATIKRYDIGASVELSDTMSLPFSSGVLARPSIAEDSGIIYVISGEYYYQVSSNLLIAENQIPLSYIFSTECERSMLISPADVDATGLTDAVTGFKVTAIGSIRNAVEPLRGAWPFDVVQAGYKIKATSRGSASVVTIPAGDLAIDTQLTESREMDSQLPQNVTVKYIDRSRDYDSNEQRAQRDNTEAVNSLVLELPVVLSANQSAQVAEKLIRIYALEKSDFSFTLPAPYRYLEPGDVVTIATDDADYALRLVSVNQTADGRLGCAGRPSNAATYTSIAQGDGGQTGGVTIPLAGDTVGLLIDCPVIDESLQDAPGFAVGMNGYSAGWPGGILYRTADNGQTWDELQALTGRATAGFAIGTLGASAGNLIQRGGSLTVSLIGGTLESVTEVQMLNGANIAAYGINGRWEIIRFQNATLNGDGTYTIDTFWRGDKGTEWTTGLHTASDYFVLMTDPDLAFVGMPTDSIGQPREYRSVTAGADIDSAASESFTYGAVNLETLSGVHPKGVRSSGDLTVTWQRRTRVGGAWRDYVDASLGETSQNYEVDVMDGATVKRTLTSTTPSVLYTSAMQVTDFGSQQSSVTVNIYQLSAVVGRGYKLEATL